MTNRTQLWILNGRVPEPCLDLHRWAQWFGAADRHVAKDEIAGHQILVSTVFIGIDHNFVSNGPPVLFETMVFGEEHAGKLFGRDCTMREDLEQRRYSTWAEAEAGHQRIVQRYRDLEESAVAQSEAAIGVLKMGKAGA